VLRAATNEPPQIHRPADRPQWAEVLSPWVPLSGERAMLAGGYGIALCLAVMSAVSFLRVMLDGHLDPDGSNLPPGRYLLVVLPIAAAQLLSGWLFMKAWAGAGQLSWRRLAAVALLIHACAAAALPLSSNDIFSNLANGQLWSAGLNPYFRTPADLGPCDPFQLLVGRQWYRSITPYGPIVIWMSQAAVVSGDLWTAMWVFKLELAVVSLATLAMAFAFCRQCLSAEAGPRSFLFLAWNPLLAWELTGQVHNDALMVAACMAFVWAAQRHRQLLAGAALAVAFYAKFAVAPVLGLYGLFVLRRHPLRGLALGIMVASLGVLLFGPFWEGPRTLTGLIQAGATTPFHICHSLISVASRLANAIDSRWPIDLLLFWSWPCTIGFGLLAGLLAWRARTLSAVLAGSMVFLFLYECLAMGWFFPWYVTWLFPLAIAQGDRKWQQIVGAYSVLAPLVYVPSDAFLVGTVIVQSVPLALWWHTRGEAANPAAQVADAAPVHCESRPLAA
jgi:hypothetical protein